MDAYTLLNKTLDNQQTNRPAAGFIPELERHLQLYSNDDKFIIAPSRDGTGYGQVTCMEDSCYKDMALTADPRKPDGGRADGFGSLQVFHDHINSDKEHRQARDARVALAKSLQKNAIKPVTPSIDRKPNVGVQRLGEGKAKLNGTPKATPKASSSQNKRTSSAGVLVISDEEGSDLRAPYGSADKKPKLNPEPNVFAERGNAIAGPAPRDVVPAAAVKKAEPDYDQQIRDLEAQRRKKREVPPPWISDHFSALDDLTRQINLARQMKQNAQLARFGAQPRNLPGQQPIGANVNQLEVTGINPHGGAPNNNPYGLAANVQGAQQLAEQNRQAALAAAGFGGDSGSDSEGDDPMLGLGIRNRGAAVDVDTEDFHELLKAAAEGDSFEGNGTVDEAAEKLGLKKQNDHIPGMRIPLMAHQLMGVAWMCEQENSKHYGGILGDEMGLGKTIQTIATMCKNLSSDPKERTNLIVAPVALLEQWKDEIEDKCDDGFFKILVYHGKGKEGITKVKHLQKYDVVLTSYHTLAGEWPDEESAVKKSKAKAKKAGSDADEDDFLILKKPGILIEMGWYRVILDEAQNIRNRSTKTSRTVAQLDSLFRWCLTGTPVTNSLSDLFPLLRFLQIKPFYEWPAYREQVVIHEKRRPDVAGRKAQAILRGCMMRRKKDSKLDGKELVTLPEKTIELRELDFSQEERDIYGFVEARSQATFNKFLKAGSVLKNYAHVLVMLLRLRQVCFHPCLISEGIQDEMEQKATEAANNERELQRARDVLKKGVVEKILEQRLEAAVARCRAERESKDATFDEDDCPVCMEPAAQGPDGGRITSCQHVFCKGCIDAVLDKDPVEDDENEPRAIKYKASERPCPNCRQPVSAALIFPLAAFEPSDEDVIAIVGVVRNKDDEGDEAMDDGKDLADFIVDDDEEDQKDDDDEDDAPVTKKVKQPNRRIIQDSDDEGSQAEEEDSKPSSSRRSSKGKGKLREDSKADTSMPDWMAGQEPSTKMLWALEEVNRLDLEAPDDKIIIISSFTTALDLMADMLYNAGHKVTRYQGDMSRKERDASVKVLKKSKKCKIMLMSLKCGGVGLNLTRANRVISLDLAWSNAVESQAFDRCHRIGQLKPVTVDRLTIKNTVEQRIYDMQTRKANLADAAMGEGKGAKIGKLSVAELAGLFGIVLSASAIR